MFRHSSFIIRHSLLLLLALIPFLTLLHKNDQGRWDTNRSLMAAPDEFSYILTAQSILHGHGISTQTTLGLDTFYPPGYPLLLAAWATLFGLTPFSAHLLNALLLSAATLIIYFFTQRLLNLLNDAPPSPPHLVTPSPCHPATAPLLITALFITNWTVLESALYIFSEPAFMLITFAWLALTLKWKTWHLHPAQTLAVALLAIAAWSLRGAGLVCLAATLAYPAAALLHQLWTTKLRPRPSPQITLPPCHLVTLSFPRRIICLALILTLAFAYQLALLHFSPEKSLLSLHPSPHSYLGQLSGGITMRGTFQFSHPDDWPPIAARIANLAVSHLNDFAQSFTPWLRDPPDLLPRYLVGKILALLALAGFALRLARFRRQPQLHLLNLYLVLYFALYLLWPFNSIRFWSPILPLMLAFIPTALRHFSPPRRSPHSLFTLPHLLFFLLLILNIEELALHLGDYQRRINYVSDSLAASAAAVIRLSPDPQKTTLIVAGDDEHLLFAWYFHQLPHGAGFLPQSPQFPNDSPQSLLLRRLQQLAGHPHQKLFVLTYFTDPYFPEIFINLQHSHPALMNQFQIRPIFRRGWDTAAWEFRPEATAQSSPAEKQENLLIK